jgi:hypothetical protein
MLGPLLGAPSKSQKWALDHLQRQRAAFYGIEESAYRPTWASNERATALLKKGRIISVTSLFCAFSSNEYTLLAVNKKLLN